MNDNEIEGSLQETLQLINPPEAAFTYFKGESRKIVYKLRNIGAHPFRDFSVKALTRIKVGDGIDNKPIFQDTKVNYAKVLSYPGNMNAQQTKDLEVLISVPPDYNEKIIYKGRPVVQACRVFVIIKSIEHITEL